VSLQQSDAIAGVVIVRPEVFGDKRGRFVETYRRDVIPDGQEMVQSNRSEKRCIREPSNAQAAPPPSR